MAARSSLALASAVALSGTLAGGTGVGQVVTSLPLASVSVLHGSMAGWPAAAGLNHQLAMASLEIVMLAAVPSVGPSASPPPQSAGSGAQVPSTWRAAASAAFWASLTWKPSFGKNHEVRAPVRSPRPAPAVYVID